MTQLIFTQALANRPANLYAETIEQRVDRAGYETLQKTNPKLLAAIENAIKHGITPSRVHKVAMQKLPDRKSTRLNSSHH